MKIETVKFQSINDMLDFVNKIENCPYHVEAKNGSSTVNAKCLFGLVNLGLNKEVELKIHNGDGDCKEFLRNIRPYHMSSKREAAAPCG